jgi:hypothetical protein
MRKRLQMRRAFVIAMHQNLMFKTHVI